MRIAPWLGALCVVATPTLTDAQVVRLPGTQPNELRQPLVEAAQCAECHGGAQTPAGTNYMPADLWPASLHANAARDPLFLATLTDAEQDVPTFGQFCLRCHTPTGFTGGRALPGLGTALDPLSGDLDGVHCDTCHRSVDASRRATAPDPMAPYAGDARLFFDDAPAGTQVNRHGPRADPFMSNRHGSVGDAFVRDARLCGQCHDVTNPLVHRLTLAGADTGEAFPLQSTFTEWAQSDYPRRTDGRSTCQDCHMRAETGALAVARVPDAPTRMNPRRHDFVGANEWMVGVLRGVFDGEKNDAFDAQRAATREFLQGAATLEIVDAPREVAAGAMARVTVRVTNNSGHKLPTGFEDARQMWLEVSAGSTVVSGAFANDALVEDAQLRAYRFVPGVLQGGRAVPDDHLARHTLVIEDTRIPPRGMVPTARTQPVGRDYGGGSGGALRNDDTATFMVPTPVTAGPLTVTVRLLNQATTKHYVETIAADNHTDDRGRQLLAAWNATGRGAPFAMATQRVTVQVTGTADAGVGDAGAAGPGAGDGGGCSAGPGAGARLGWWWVAALAIARRRRGRPRRA